MFFKFLLNRRCRDSSDFGLPDSFLLLILVLRLIHHFIVSSWSLFFCFPFAFFPFLTPLTLVLSFAFLIFAVSVCDPGSYGVSFILAFIPWASPLRYRVQPCRAKPIVVALSESFLTHAFIT